MHSPTRIIFILLTISLTIFYAVAKDDELPSSSLKEDVKIIRIKQINQASQHNQDISNLKEDIRNLKQELTEIFVKRNEKGGQTENLDDSNDENNSVTPISSFEWTQNIIDKLRSDIKHIANKVDNIEVKMDLIQNDMQKFKVEVNENIKQLEDLSFDADQQLKMEFLERREKAIKNHIKQTESRFNKYFLILLRSLQQGNDHLTTKYRHKRHNLINLEKSFMKMQAYDGNVLEQIIELKEHVHSTSKSTEKRLTILENEYNIANRSVNSQIDKLHSSMLELLESVEAQETRFDKMIPEFQNEFNKLEIDNAQMNSHYNYVKSNQETIRESIKAIAVSVSNVMQKIEDDRILLDKINRSTIHLQDQIETHCNSQKDKNSKDVNSTADDDDYETEISQEDDVNHVPKSCEDIKEMTGTYKIKPDEGRILETFCSEGWTLMQSRFDGSVDFNRNFMEYAEGFGNPAGEYWIGNEALHRITRNNCTMLRIQMVDIDNKIWIANYENIRVGPENDGYRLIVNGFTGNATDALEYQNNMEFSTVGRDHDISRTNCAADYEGGWWFSHCQHANLNGKYTLGLTWFDSKTNQWIAVKSSRMTIKGNPACVKQY